MEPFNIKEFEAIKKKAETLYKETQKIRCPALQADVHFTSDGFHHLQFDGSRSERSKPVQKAKMLCLSDAIKVISKTTTIQEYRETIQPTGKPDRSGLRKTKRVKYYAFEAVTDEVKARRIKIVVRRIGDGNHHFWSVMPKWFEEKINELETIRKVGGTWMYDV